MNFLKGFLLSIFVFFGADTYAISIKGINQKTLNLQKVENNFSFYVAGHSFGSPGFSIHPSHNLINFIPKINSSTSSFFVSLGGNVRSISYIDIKNYRNMFAYKLDTPIFTAVGKHDLKPHSFARTYTNDYENYKRFFGETEYKFSVQNNLFLFLDSEKNDGVLDKNQEIFFKESIKNRSPSVKNIFIFTYRPIWNNNWFFSLKKNIIPFLKKLNLNIFWFSTDQYENFYWKRDGNILFLSTSLRDSIEDKIAMVNISDDDVSISSISLTELKSHPFSDYQVPLNYKRHATFRAKPTFPEILNNIYQNKYFRYGVIFAISLVIFLIATILLTRKMIAK